MSINVVATPVKSRVGKSRQVSAKTLTVEGLSSRELQPAVEAAFFRYADHSVYFIIDIVSEDREFQSGALYCDLTHQPLARIDIIKEKV